MVEATSPSEHVRAPQRQLQGSEAIFPGKVPRRDFDGNGGGLQSVSQRGEVAMGKDSFGQRLYCQSCFGDAQTSVSPSGPERLRIKKPGRRRCDVSRTSRFYAGSVVQRTNRISIRSEPTPA